MKLQLPYSLLLVTFLASRLPAQDMRRQVISVADGLSQGMVNDILQDEDGFMWFATADGLNRYDGRQFRSFRRNAYNPYSLPSNVVSDIYTDPAARLWVVTTLGISIFDKKTERFSKLVPLDRALEPYLNASIFSISGVGNSLFVLNNSGTDWTLLKIDPTSAHTSGSTTKVQTRAWSLPTNQTGWVSGFLPISQDQVLLSASQGIFLLNLRPDATVELKQTDQPFRALMNRKVSVFSDETGRYWLAGQDEIRCYTASGDTVKQAGLRRLDKTIAAGLCAAGLVFRQNDEVFLMPYNEVFRKARKTTWSLGALETDLMINQIFSDPAGVIWLSVGTRGLLKLSPPVRGIEHYFRGVNIVSLAKAGDSALLLNNQQQRYPPELNRAKTDALLLDLADSQHQTSPLTRETLIPVYHNVRRNGVCMREASGCFVAQDFLLCADRKLRIPIPEKFGNWWHPGFFQMDSNGLIWSVYCNDVLAVFNSRTGAVQAWSFKHLMPGSLPGYCLNTAFWVDSNNNIWIGTGTDGLLRASYDQGQIRFQHYPHNPNQRNSLSHYNVLAILEDSKDPDCLWIGTRGGGLDKLDISRSSFTHYTTLDGLPNDVVYGILPGGSQLWLSTNRGISRFDPAANTFHNFTPQEGLQEFEFNTGAFAEAAPGVLAFGGVNGLNIIYTKEVSFNSVGPKICLTALFINGALVQVRDSSNVLQQAVTFTKSIRLPHDQNTLGFEFAALDFSNPAFNRYRYRMEGVNEQWIEAGNKPGATYANLSPGKYVFFAEGITSSGVWSTNPATIAIHILPPWYRTIPAYLAYICFIGGLIYLYFRFKLTQLKLRNDLEAEQKEALRLQELDQMKSRFFANITHEFRTPLTLILGNTDLLLRAEKEQFPTKIQAIRNNGKRLLTLINQILDLRKLEAGALKIHYVQGNLIPLLHYITDSFQSLADARSIQLSFDSQTPELVMDYDHEKLFTIVNNLLSNALKFTNAGGSVRLCVSREGNNAVISVEDTGVGIAPEALTRIFDRFYQAPSQPSSKEEAGTGIGLTLVKEFATLLGGSILVSSEVGKGSRFEVRLPVRQIAPLQQQVFYPETDGLFLETPPSTPLIEVGEDAPLLLIVEDNEEVSAYIASCLERLYRLVFAKNGAEGIEKAVHLVPDLIISDVMMPLKDGFQLLEAVKTDERTSHIPVILLTARAEVEDRLMGLQRGANGYLAKPFNEKELLLNIMNLLALRKQFWQRYAKESAVILQALPSETASIEIAIEDAFFRKVLEVITRQLSNADFSVEDLCRAVHISHPQLHRKLIALCGLSAVQLIRRERLAQARALLRDPNTSIAEVAYASGFNDPAYFTRIFARETGSTPSEYRNSGK